MSQEEDQAVIQWTRPMLRRLKTAIYRAKTFSRDTFRFDGHDFYVPYAIYLAAYLDDTLSKEDDEDKSTRTP